MKEDAKALTVQKVSAVLRKAGFAHSKSYSTSVRGWRSYTEGFRARNGFEGPVLVAHKTDLYGDGRFERIDAELAKYAATLKAAGLHVYEENRQLVVSR